MTESYDLIVIGAGVGGYTAAIRAAKLGMRTAVVEQAEAGGTCLNRGCIPAKAMLHVSELLGQIAKSGHYGLTTGPVKVDYEKLCAYRSQTIARLVQGVEALLQANGVAYLHGKGTLMRNKQVRIRSEEGEKRLSARSVILASGSAPRKLAVPGMDLENVLDSDSLLALKELPESMVIIGGGVIGVEYAQAFAAMGTRVVILEAESSLLPGWDREISRNLKTRFKRQGIEVHTETQLKSILREEGSLVCRYFEKGREEKAVAQCVLCAVGRQANTNGLLEDDAALEFDRGRILVDEHFETSMADVYAIGDLIGGVQLAHVASAQGVAVAEYLSGREPSADTTVIPCCIYTEPEIAAVGLSEEEASRQGIQTRVGRFLMGANSRSVIAGDERGFIKIVADPQDGRILGAQLMCARATDMIGEMIVAVVNRLTVRQMLRAIRAHPTYDESIREALEELDGGAIHMMP